MKLPLSLSALTLYSFIYVSVSYAEVIGPSYPAPTDLTSTDSAVFKAWQNITATFNSYLAANEIPGTSIDDLTNLTFSVGAFSVTDPTASSALQYHHAGYDLSTADLGVNTVNGDSIYRIGSVSKVLTAYLVLLHLGEEGWNRPITDFIPELLQLTPESNDETKVVDWNTVTLGALASHMGGIVRNPAPYSIELLARLPQLGIDPIAAGFPPVNISDPAVWPRCGQEVDIDCPDPEYLQSLANADPIFQTWTSPAYSNPGFSLLGLALENLTGMALPDVFREGIFEPLNMNGSYNAPPMEYTNAVIPSGSLYVNLTYDATYGASDASGGVFSTLNDLAKFGVAILNSTLLPPDVTRKWLKPVTHTSKKEYSVGRPWEIARVNISQNGRINDIYTKAGDISLYSAYYVSSPEHAAGFNVLVASSMGGTPLAAATIADIIAMPMVEALEAQAATEAMRNFAGTYRSSDNNLNSSLTLKLLPETGLIISSWISNGSDVLTLFEGFIGEPLILAPSIPSPVVGTSRRVAFRATKQSQDRPGTIGPITYQYFSNSQWLGIDNFKYGSEALDLFFFDLNEQGRAVQAVPASTRAPLARVS